MAGPGAARARATMRIVSYRPAESPQLIELPCRQTTPTPEDPDDDLDAEPPRRDTDDRGRGPGSSTATTTHADDEPRTDDAPTRTTRRARRATKTRTEEPMRPAPRSHEPCASRGSASWPFWRPRVAALRPRRGTAAADHDHDHHDDHDHDRARGTPALISQVATAKPECRHVIVVGRTASGMGRRPRRWCCGTHRRWPASQDEFADRPDLPREDYPIQGRYATATGLGVLQPQPLRRSVHHAGHRATGRLGEGAAAGATQRHRRAGSTCHRST